MTFRNSAAYSNFYLLSELTNLNMQNSYAKPHTLGQLLLASLGWAAGSWGGWLAALTFAAWLLPHSEWLGNVLVIGGFLLVQAAVWLKAVPRGWRASRATADSMLMQLANVWLLLLVGSHLVFLVLFLLGLAFAMSGPMQF
jgi:hypothetical protein